MSVVDASASVDYDKEDFDWDNYDAFRPSYPQALFDEIFNYHARSDGQWKVACDFGTGSGTIIPELLSKFVEVRASDAHRPQIQLAQKRLFREMEQGKVSFYVESAGNEKCEWIKDQEADLFIAAEAIHWFDRPKWFQQASQKLKKGGTLAYLFYSTKPMLYTHPGAERAWANLHGHFFAGARTKAERGNWMAEALVCDYTTMSSLARPSSEWFGEQEFHRWLIRPEFGKHYIRPHPRELIEAIRTPDEERNDQELVSEKIKVVDHTPDTAGPALLRTEGWRVGDLIQYLLSLSNTGIKASDPDVLRLSAELEKAVGGPEERVGCAWPLQLALATRK